MTHAPLVISVILNTNHRDDTLACLATLTRNTYPNHKAIVLDNASSDGSVEAIRAAFPAVEIVSLTENEGYAGNNNVGIQRALAEGADWVFVLNEDTELAPDCIEKLVAAGESDTRTGIVGPMVYHCDERNVIQSAGGRLDRFWQGSHIAQNELDQGQFTEPHAVDWISGCAILVRRQAILRNGMLDARFFYYWEEVEWCLRLSKAGWQVMQVPAARVWHKGVQRAYQPKPSVTYYNTRNRFFMLKKHRASLPIWGNAWFQTVRTLVSWTVRPKWRDQREHRDALWQGSLDFLRQRWGQWETH